MGPYFEIGEVIVYRQVRGVHGLGHVTAAHDFGRVEVVDQIL
jgi:hypothetical protein